MYRDGMDADAVARIGRQLQDEAAQVQRVLSEVASLVAEATGSWHGPDAKTFSSTWSDSHRPALVHVVRMLETMGGTALNNAAEQRRVSGR